MNGVERTAMRMAGPGGARELALEFQADPRGVPRYVPVPEAIHRASGVKRSRAGSAQAPAHH